MRLENSARNVTIAWLGQLFYVLCNFITRGVFAAELSSDYLGLENLFTSVLTILSLAELGVGSAIVFSLYRPLADDDREKVRSLMRLFRRAYTTIGIAVGVIGLCLTPFITNLIKDVPDIPYIHLYFLCFVANSAVSYFFSYKGSLIAADQKKYVVSLIQYAFQVLMSLAQIAVLLLTHNYFLFLGCMIASSLLQNIVIAKTADRMYPYIKDKGSIQKLDGETVATIKKNIAALVMHRMAGVASTPASSLIISNFIGLGAVAIYGNYIMVTNALTRIMDQGFDAITASVGNLGATESRERQYEVFQTTFFVNAFLCALIVVPLFCVFNPFVVLWLGESYLFPVSIMVLIVLLFYLKSMRSAALSFTSAFGLYWFTRWKAIIETVVLIALSLVLVVNFAIAGVVVAGIISCISASITIEGYMLYKHGFKRSCGQYFRRFALYAVITLALAALSYFICSFLPETGVLALLAKGAIGIGITLVAFSLIFGRTREYCEFKSMVRRLLLSLKARLSRSKEKSK